MHIRTNRILTTLLPVHIQNRDNDSPVSDTLQLYLQCETMTTSSL